MGNGQAKNNGHPVNGTKSRGKKLAIEQLEIKRNVGDNENDESIFEGLVKSKPGITFESIRRASGQVVKWSGHLTVAFPAFNTLWGEPCGYLLMRNNGENFPPAGTLQARNKHNLRGSADGFVIAGGFRRLQSSKVVWKAEGVPDLLALAGHLPHAHIVIANICGAKSKQLPFEWFAGKTVYVVPDADAPGMAGAKAFAGRAAQHAESVRVVPLPFEQTKDGGKDLRDFLNGGGTFADLEEIAKAAKPIETSEKQSNAGGAIDDPYRLANCVMERFPNLLHYRNDFHRFTNPAYQPLSVDDVRAMVVPVVKSEFSQLTDPEKDPPKITKTMIGNVFENLKALVHESSTRDAPFWLGKPKCPADRCMVTQNAVIDLESIDNGTARTFPPTAELFTHNAVEYSYDPEADCPTWLEFLDGLWGIQSDHVPTLQEMMGYWLGDDTSQQKLFMFIGVKRSGKGTIARVCRHLVGLQNVCNPILGNLQGDFGLEPLLGKRLAIVGDARLSGRQDAGIIVERLLSISGEDSQTVNRKFKAAVTTQLRTRFLLISNELPKLNDASATLPSRIILLTFNRSFYGNEDPKLTDKLLTELPGILLWSLHGWERLKKRGRFVQPEDSQELIGEMEELSSPTLAFLNERIEVGTGYRTPINDVFESWKVWCDEKGRRPGSHQTFGRDLRAALPSLRVSQPRIAGRQVRCYESIKLKDF